MTTLNPRFLGIKPPGEDPRGVADILRRLLNGKINTVGTVTLVANAGTTTLADVNIGGPSFIGLMPMTSNAATAWTTLYFSPPTKQAVVINHTNDANVDKIFRYVVLG